MALVSKGFNVKLQVRDQGDNLSQPSFDYRSTTYSTVKAHVEATLIGAYNALTKGVVYGYSISESVVEDTAALPTNGAEIENQASIVVRLATLGKTATIRIPAPEDGIMVGSTGEDYNTVDGSDAAVTAFLALFQEVAAPGDSVLMLSDGEEADDTNPFKSGKRIHRASRKG